MPFYLDRPISRGRQSWQSAGVGQECQDAAIIQHISVGWYTLLRNEMLAAHYFSSLLNKWGNQEKMYMTQTYAYNITCASMTLNRSFQTS